MSLTYIRDTKAFRFIASVLVVQLLTSPTLYAQDQFQIQDGTHLTRRFGQEKGTGRKYCLSPFSQVLALNTELMASKPFIKFL